MHSTPFWFATKKEKKKSWIKADKRKRGKKRRSVSWLRADQWGLLDHILVDCILFKETNDGETALSYFYDCVTRFCNLLQHIGLELHLLHLLLPIQYFFLLCCSCLVSHCNALCSKFSGGISHLVSHCIDCTVAFTLTHPGILCTVLLIMHCTSAHCGYHRY